MAALAALALASVAALLGGLHLEERVLSDVELAGGSYRVELASGAVEVVVSEGYTVEWRLVYSQLDVGGFIAVYVIGNSTGYELLEGRSGVADLPLGAKPSSFIPMTSEGNVIPREAETVEKGRLRVTYADLLTGRTVIAEFTLLYRDILLRAEGAAGFSLALKAVAPSGETRVERASCSLGVCELSLSGVHAQSYEVSVTAEKPLAKTLLVSLLALSSAGLALALLLEARETALAKRFSKSASHKP